MKMLCCHHTKEEEQELLTRLWNADNRSKDERFAEYGKTNDELLEALKKEILEGPVLKRPDPERRFYVKTDWSSTAQGAVLLQADITEKAEIAMSEEMMKEKCTFEKTCDGLRLRPIYFISQKRDEPSNRHSFVGEVSTGRWAFLKFKKWLMGREFTWITDCSGAKKFFETDYEATHTMQRWKLELLRFDFTIVHRPGKMLTECDMLSRYNSWTEAWRYNEPDARGPIQEPTPLTAFIQKLEQADPIPFTNRNPKVTGPTTRRRTLLAETVDTDRTAWIVNAGMNTSGEAMEQVGITLHKIGQTDEGQHWRDAIDVPDTRTWID